MSDEGGGGAAGFPLRNILHQDAEGGRQISLCIEAGKPAIRYGPVSDRRYSRSRFAPDIEGRNSGLMPAAVLHDAFHHPAEAGSDGSGTDRAGRGGGEGEKRASCSASDLAKDVLGSDIFLSDKQLSDMAGIFKDIAKIADSPLLGALNVDSKTDSSEKFSASAMSLLISMSGASEEAIQTAMAAAGYDTKGKADKEIKDTLVELNKAGALLPILKAAGSKITQEDLDFCMEYIYDSFEFSYKGNDIKDIAVYDENGAEEFRLSKLMPFAIDSISSGEGNVKSAPSFGIYITGLVSGILKSLIG